MTEIGRNEFDCSRIAFLMMKTCGDASFADDVYGAFMSV